MFLKLHSIAAILVFTCFLRFVQLESTVPVLLWSNHGQILDGQDRFKSLVDTVDSGDLVDYLGKSTRVIALVQDDLNVEQFAANDASFVSTIFENPQFNPLFFTNVKNPNNLYLDFTTNTKLDSFKQNEVFYLNGKNLKDNDAIIKSYVEQANKTGPVIFILTGKSNQYLNKNSRIRRDAIEEDPKIKVLDVKNKDDQSCLFFYSEKISFTLFNDKESKSFDFSDISNSSGECQSNVKNSKILIASNFSLTYTNNNEEVKIFFNFTQNSNAYWEVKPLTVEHKGETYINDNLYLGTENYFSYSCQKSEFSLKNASHNDIYTSANLVFYRFQIQPFAVVDSKYKFEDSFDCSVWFTLPIFASLFVSLLLVLILYFGVRALLSISTPDRFENPKGRTLIITNFEE